MLIPVAVCNATQRFSTFVWNPTERRCTRSSLELEGRGLLGYIV